MSTFLDFLQLIIGFILFWFGVGATAVGAIAMAVKVPYRLLAVPGVIMSVILIGTPTMGIAHGILSYSHPSATESLVTGFLQVSSAVGVVIALSKPRLPDT